MNSSDDYNDYGDGYASGGFDEDALNDQDYDLLHDMLPPFKERLQNSSYTDIPDDLLKEYIWEANFDPDEAFVIVQENHKRTYTPSPFLLSSLSSFLLSLAKFPSTENQRAAVHDCRRLSLTHLSPLGIVT